MDQLARIARILTPVVSRTNGKLIPSIPMAYSMSNAGIQETLNACCISPIFSSIAESPMKTNAARLTTKVRIPTASVNPRSKFWLSFSFTPFSSFLLGIKAIASAPSVGKNTIKVMSAIFLLFQWWLKPLLRVV